MAFTQYTRSFTGGIALGFRDSSIPFSYLDDDQKPSTAAASACKLMTNGSGSFLPVLRRSGGSEP